MFVRVAAVDRDIVVGIRVVGRIPLVSSRGCGGWQRVTRWRGISTISIYWRRFGIDSFAAESQGKRNRSLLIKTARQRRGVCEKHGACSQGQASRTRNRRDAWTCWINRHLLAGIAILSGVLIIAVAAVRHVPLVQSGNGA